MNLSKFFSKTIAPQTASDPYAVNGKLQTESLIASALGIEAKPFTLTEGFHFKREDIHDVNNNQALSLPVFNKPKTVFAKASDLAEKNNDTVCYSRIGLTENEDTTSVDWVKFSELKKELTPVLATFGDVKNPEKAAGHLLTKAFMEFSMNGSIQSTEQEMIASEVAAAAVSENYKEIDSQVRIATEAQQQMEDMKNAILETAQTCQGDRLFIELQNKGFEGEFVRKGKTITRTQLFYEVDALKTELKAVADGAPVPQERYEKIMGMAEGIDAIDVCLYDSKAKNEDFNVVTLGLLFADKPLEARQDILHNFLSINLSMDSDDIKTIENLKQQNAYKIRANEHLVLEEIATWTLPVRTVTEKDDQPPNFQEIGVQGFVDPKTISVKFRPEMFLGSVATKGFTVFVDGVPKTEKELYSMSKFPKNIKIFSIL